MHLRESGRRGPGEHARRDQIVTVADAYFRRYGYDKTTVGDLAKAIGFSTAYIYKFFDSKQAIGEAICCLRLTKIAADLRRIAESDRPPCERLTAIFQTLARHARDMSRRESRLREMIVAASQGRWRPFERHQDVLRDIISRVVEDGRHSGQFERETSIDQTCRAILLVLEPFWNPVLWNQRLDELDGQARSLGALVLRSLAS